MRTYDKHGSWLGQADGLCCHSAVPCYALPTRLQHAASAQLLPRSTYPYPRPGGCCCCVIIVPRDCCLVRALLMLRDDLYRPASSSCKHAGAPQTLSDAATAVTRHATCLQECADYIKRGHLLKACDRYVATASAVCCDAASLMIMDVTDQHCNKLQQALSSSRAGAQSTKQHSPTFLAALVPARTPSLCPV